MQNRFRTVAAGLILLVASCQPTAGPAGPNGSCGLGQSACTAEELRAWYEAEQARIAQAAVANEAAFDEAVREWNNRPLGAHAGSLLLQCQPQSYQASARIIGPSGGTVSFGPHDLHIPPGALSSSVVITGEIEVSQHVLVNLSPHGLTFAAAATLQLEYEHCSGESSEIRVAYVDQNLSILEYPVSSNSGGNNPGDLTGEVTASIWHFSKYAVAY